MFLFRCTVLFTVIVAEGRGRRKGQLENQKARESILQPVAAKQLATVYADVVDIEVDSTDYTDQYNQNAKPVTDSNKIDDAAFDNLLKAIATVSDEDFSEEVISDQDKRESIIMELDYAPTPSESEAAEYEDDEEGILNYSDNDGIDERAQDSFFSLAQFDPSVTAETNQAEVASDVTGDLPVGPDDSRSAYAPDVDGSMNDFTGPTNDDLKTGIDTFNACFTCDATGDDASTLMTACQATGKLVQCETDSLCLLEVRKRSGKYVGIRTLCKSKVACEDQQKQNFGPGPLLRQQCRPEDNLTSRRFGPSVCRQCFQTCDGDSSTNDGDLCFSTTNGIPAPSGSLTSFNIFNPSSPCTTSTCTEFGRSWWDAGLYNCQSNTIDLVNDCNNEAFPPGYNTYTTKVHPN